MKLVTEFHEESKTSISLEYSKKLFSQKTKYQKIEIYCSEKYGNIMMLDGCFMLTEKNNDYYHDKCISFLDKENLNQNILIIGGGDHAIAQSIISLMDINNLTIVELDKSVVDVSKKYFPKFFKNENKMKKNIKLIIDDGYIWSKKNKNTLFDAIIVDSTDPNEISKKLFSKDFYNSIYSILKENGIFIQQSGCPLINKNENIKPILDNLKDCGFMNIMLESFPMPIYPLGTWSFVKCERRK